MYLRCFNKDMTCIPRKYNLQQTHTLVWNDQQSFYLQPFSYNYLSCSFLCMLNVNIEYEIYREKSIPMTALWCPTFSNHG